MDNAGCNGLSVAAFSSPERGLDPTTVESQPGAPARATYRHNSKPAYPPLARRQGQEGVVFLDVKVTAEGHAAGVALKQTSGFRLLDEAAINAVRKSEIEPARIWSRAVESEIEVPVRFERTS